MRLRHGKKTSAGAPHAAGAGGQAGFTLIETAIAMLVLLVAALGVASMFAYAVNTNRGGISRSVALTVAQHRLESLRNLPFDSPQLAATAASPPAQTVTRGGGTFLVTTIIADAPGSLPSPAATVKRKTITVRVAPTGTGLGYSTAPATLMTTRTAYSNGPYLE